MQRFAANYLPARAAHDRQICVCVKRLTSVAFPASVTEIGQYAFDGCENLEEAEFAVAVGWAFYNAGGVKIAEVSETEITSSAAEILTNIHLNKYFLFRA